MTFSTSLVAVCCSNDLVRSVVLWRNSFSNRAFSMAITAWAAKVVASSICFSVNGLTLIACERKAADHRPVAQERHSKDTSCSRRRVDSRARTQRIRGRPAHPQYEWPCPPRHDPPGHATAVRASRVFGPRVLFRLGRKAIVGGHPKHVSILPLKHGPFVGRAKARR